MTTRGIRSFDRLNLSHASLLCCQGMEENHDGQDQDSERGSSPKGEKKKATRRKKNRRTQLSAEGLPGGKILDLKDEEPVM